MDQDQLTERIRHRIVGLLHVRHLSPGDRLPSIRRTAAETGVDHRAVAEAYRTLEREGLVEVRPASGVYVAADGAGAVEVLLHAPEEWVAEMLLDGWRRGLSRAEAAEAVRAAGVRPLRCGLVEVVEDTRVALAAELEAGLGLEVVTVPELGGWPEAGVEPLDLVVTSVFLAEAVSPAAAEAGIPCVVAGIHPDFAAAVDAILTESPVVAVMVDPGMAERAEAYFSVTSHSGRIRASLLASEIESLDAVEREWGLPVLATRAARRVLGADDYHLVPSPPPLLSEATVRDILRIAAAPPPRPGAS